MDLLKHVAKYHFKDQGASSNNNSEEDDLENHNDNVKVAEKDKVSDFLKQKQGEKEGANDTVTDFVLEGLEDFVKQ